MTSSRTHRIPACLAAMLPAWVAVAAPLDVPPHLSAAQRVILASPAAPPPPADFSFESPPGPQFTAAEKRAQREAASGVLPAVMEAYRAGAETVRIPPGDYRFGQERWDRDGVVHALLFEGLRREPEHTFTIDATGATFWFDLPDDQAPTAHFAVGFKDCRHVVFRGATIDRGTTLDAVTIRHTADDAANIHGYWGHVTASSGNRVAFGMREEFRRTVWRDLAVGDRLVFHDKTSGETLGEAAVVAFDAESVTVDQPVDAFTNAIVEWPDHGCAGWTIRNCHWADDYQRLLIQSGPGTVRNCTFSRLGSAIELNSVMPFVEGGVPRHITIADNLFTDVNPVPHGATIAVHSRTCGAGKVRFGPLVVTGNTFVRPGGPAIDLAGVRGVTIAGNRFERPVERTAVARPGDPCRRQAIHLAGCTDVRVEANTVVDPGGHLEPDPVTRSVAVGCDERCADVRVDDDRE